MLSSQGSGVGKGPFLPQVVHSVEIEMLYGVHVDNKYIITSIYECRVFIHTGAG